MSLLSILDDLLEDKTKYLNPYTAKIQAFDEPPIHKNRFDDKLMNDILDLYLNGNLYPNKYYRCLNLKDAEALRTAICRYYEKRFGERLPGKYQITKLYADDIRNSRISTCREIYGVDYSSQSDAIKSKKRATYTANYGVDHPFKSPEMRERLRQTFIQKYGVDNPFKSPEIKAKIKKTLIETYGVDNPLKSEAVKCKMRKTNILKYGVDNPGVLPSLTGIGNLDDEFCIWRYNKLQELSVSSEDSENYNALKDHILNNYDGSSYFINTLKYKIRDPRTRQPSKIETKISNALAQLNLAFQANVLLEFMRHPATNRIRELDFFLPDYNLAIEVNGSYTHSVDSVSEPDYHRFKFESCASNNIKLLMFTEAEILNEFDMVVNIIKYHVNLTESLDISKIPDISHKLVRYGLKSILESTEDKEVAVNDFTHIYPV